MKDHEIRELVSRTVDEIGRLYVCCDDMGMDLNLGRVRTILQKNIVPRLRDGWNEDVASRENNQEV